jgi:hypothetical protein
MIPSHTGTQSQPSANGTADHINQTSSTLVWLEISFSENRALSDTDMPVAFGCHTRSSCDRSGVERAGMRTGYGPSALIYIITTTW